MVYGRGSQYQKQEETGGVAMDIDEKMEDLRKRIREAELGGGEKRIKSNMKKEDDAKERIDYLR
jgi:acetyl-CoA carboxylase carboxyltransferase component